MKPTTREAPLYAVVLTVLALTIMIGVIYADRTINATEANRDRMDRIEAQISSMETQLQTIQQTVAKKPTNATYYAMDNGARQQIELMKEDLAVLKGEVHSYALPVQEWLDRFKKK